tara:strand:+ start:157 stop:936 length:780 start_codon:yes stop_codon:yes gene_type:complete
MKLVKLTATLSIILLLSGCGGNPVIPVSDLTPNKSRYPARIVEQGDSLYTIAWEFGLDYREVALWNRLRPPYHVTPGQKIRLGPAKVSEQSSGNLSHTIVKALEITELRARPLAEKVQKDSGKSTKQNSSNANADQKQVWSWPSAGRVVSGFSPTEGSNGIDIVGIEGSPIVAAAPGRIVYAGSGLRGYGLLLILKHDEHFLSAYAHNSLLLVDEGDSVRAEQVIAHMGSTDAETVRLHFEIRLDGKPVDPLMYLPARQ